MSALGSYKYYNWLENLTRKHSLYNQEFGRRLSNLWCNLLRIAEIFYLV